MKILKVFLKGLTASFRKPKEMRYQAIVPFPPPTTIIGLFGAALGFDYSRAQEEFKNLKIGIKILQKLGTVRDLWAIRKMKSDAKTFEKAVVIREWLFKPAFELFVLGDYDILRNLKGFLSAPAYPLSFGRDEDLITYIESKLLEAFEIPGGEIQNVVLKGELSPEDFKINVDELEERLRAFPVYQLTTSFYTKK